MTARETAMRRIALFLLTNIAVLFLLSIVCHLFGVDTWAASRGYGGMGGLLAFAAIFGMIPRVRQSARAGRALTISRGLDHW